MYIPILGLAPIKATNPSIDKIVAYFKIPTGTLHFSAIVGPKVTMTPTIVIGIKSFALILNTPRTANTIKVGNIMINHLATFTAVLVTVTSFW